MKKPTCLLKSPWVKTAHASLKKMCATAIPFLVSLVAKGLLAYHGLGSGIKRALDAWPDIEFYRRPGRVPVHRNGSPEKSGKFGENCP